MDGGEKIMAELREIPVLCTNGTKAPLSTCYMPLRELRSIQSRLSSTDILPFLDVLPRRLLSWIMAPPDSTEMPAGNFNNKALSAVVSILNCKLPTVSTIIKTHGVPHRQGL